MALLPLVLSTLAIGARWAMVEHPLNAVTPLIDATVVGLFAFATFAAFTHRLRTAFGGVFAGSLLAIAALPHFAPGTQEGALAFAGLCFAVLGLHPDPHPHRFVLALGLPGLVALTVSTLLLDYVGGVQSAYFIANGATGLFVAWAFSLARYRTRGQAERAQAQLMASDRMASIGVIAAGLGHEINNPLAYIQMNLAAVLATDDLNLEDRDALTDAAEGAHRIAAVVKNLGFFARPERDPVVIEVDPVARTIIDLVTPQIRHRGQIEFVSAGPVYIRDANGRLGQILLNLLTNAIAATVDTSTARLEVKVEASNDVVTLTVRDNGPGVPAEVGDRVFDSFFTTKAPGEGTGLGLSICRHLAASGGGSVRLLSTGPGAAFAVELPRAFPDAPAFKGPAPAATAPRARVLIIDDDQRVCRAMARALKTCAVDTAFSGSEGLALLDTESYDIVLCDAMMPELSGLDVYRRVLADDPAVARRFVFVTGGAHSGLSEDDLVSTGRPVLRKPVKPDALQEIVERARDRGPEASATTD